jgi:hypothetical protein
MSPLLRAAAALLAVAGLGAAEIHVDPAPAVVTKIGGSKFPDAFVFEETIDGGISFTVEDPKNANAPRSKFGPGTYTVEYKSSQNRDFLTAVAFEKDHPEKSVDLYLQVEPACRYDWERQEAYLGAARSALAAKAYDKGVQAIQGLEKDYPKSLSLPEGLELKGEALAKKGDADGATKVFQVLLGHEKDWGVAAASRGAKGLGQMLFEAGKGKEAIDQVAPWAATKLKPEANPREFAELGLALAEYQQKAGDAAAEDTIRRVAYAPCAHAYQARAQLAWAKLLQAKGDPASTIAAFDHAGIASALPGAEGATREEAHRICTGLVPIIAATGKDENEKQKLTTEYKSYLQKL